MPERSLAASVKLDKIEEVQEDRSSRARLLDSQFDAEITSDVDTWASDPSHYDYPGVDTGPTFRDEQGGDFDTEAFVDGVYEFGSNTRGLFD